MNNSFLNSFNLLILKAPKKIAADDTFVLLLLSFIKIRLDVSCESCLAEDSHEISGLIFSEKQ